MLHRHDFVTPYIDGLRFFDKPPLMYWMAAGSMKVFGEFDWAARLPLAIAVLALLVSIYALGLRLYSERGALYSALIMATAIGPYLYTRFFIPDIMIALWMTLSVHCFLVALERIQSRAILSETRNAQSRLSEAQSAQSKLSEAQSAQSRLSEAQSAQSRLSEARNAQSRVILSEAQSAQSKDPEEFHTSQIVQTFLPPNPASALLPCLAFAATLALNLLTKGLIGILFPIGFVVIYLAVTQQLRFLPKFHIALSTLVFAIIALPWHILAWLRNPAIPMPPGIELPAQAGWAWFYLYNEHVARFLAKRVPHDYGQTPVWLFWLYAIIWIFPWAIFLPAAVTRIWRNRRDPASREADLTVALWALLVLVFFSISSRQEYYSVPALPALALLAGGWLARAECTSSGILDRNANRWSIESHRWLLLPIASLIGVTCGFLAIAAPTPLPDTDLSALLSTNPQMYNLSLGHLFDLTGRAMGLFRGPLTTVAIGMAILGPVSYGLRRKGRTYAANLVLAGGMTLVLLAAHEGLVRFNPILGSKDLAEAIVETQSQHPEPNDLILLDGELTSGSTLLFYTRQTVGVVNGRVNGLWFGSFWPDAPPLFENESTLRQAWAGPRRIFLLTPTPASRTTNLQPFGPVHVLASSGGKTILTNR